MSTDIRVALVYEQDAGTQGLRTALANAGVVIALECRASALDSSAILATAVDAIVVNLDAELEELLDVVTEALDLATQPVIYNDPAASSDLSGWDRARWMRHLSAKLKGQSNVTPPPPPGAQAIPMPVRPVEAPIAPAKTVTADTASAPSVVAAASAAQAALPDASTGLDFADLALTFDTSVVSGGAGNVDTGREERLADQPPASSVDTSFDLGLADLDLMFEVPDAASEAPDVAALPVAGGNGADERAAASSDASVDFDMADLESIFDEPATVPTTVGEPHGQPLVLGEDIGDLDALFGTAPDADEGAPVVGAATAPADTVEFELDSLFTESADPVPTLPNTVATQTELTDLDALFREFEASQSAASTPAPAVSQASDIDSSAPSSTPTKQAEPRSAPMEWSLEPVELEAPAPQGDRLVAEWRLDTPSKPLAPAELKAAVAPPPAKAPSTPAIPADLDASLALADFRLLDDAVPAAASNPSSSAADLDTFDLSSLELGSVETTAAIPGAPVPDDGLSLADLDFDFITDPIDAPTRGVIATDDTDGGLGDLDSLFEPAMEAPLVGLSLSDLDRVFVLGASIGGPEAIKSFLARLPASVPAAFVVAQHMGSEFLEMMAMQLDAASPLPVRCPKAGERLRHGEVIVAPANEQLSIDDSGHVRLSAASSGSPYNPSIDHLVRAAADRFGDHATLILFSGMGTDAVEGGRYLTSRGGQVWAQDRASCVIASMIDSAKSQGLIRFEGTPTQLAERVLQVLS